MNKKRALQIAEALDDILLEEDMTQVTVLHCTSLDHYVVTVGEGPDCQLNWDLGEE